MPMQTKDEGRRHFRELIVDGKSVSWLTLIDYTIRIGNARLRMGGIAGVGTSEDCRRKGHSRVVLEDTTSYMQQEGYDVALLFGIPDYYHKFGYAACIAEPMFTIKIGEIEHAKKAESGCRIRPEEASDLPSIMDLHNLRNTCRTFSLVRYAEYFDGFSKPRGDGRQVESLVVENAHDGFIGYFVAQAAADFLNVGEVECADPNAFKLILSHLAEIAKSKDLESIRFLMPREHPFSTYCRRLNCVESITHNRRAGGMARIINQNTMFVKLREELSRRLEASAYAGYTGSLLVITELGETMLSILDGDVRVTCAAESPGALDIPQSRLMQLVAGYRPISDLLADEDVSLTGGVEGLVDALFPTSEPYTWLADHF